MEFWKLFPPKEELLRWYETKWRWAKQGLVNAHLAYALFFQRF